ncbi:hypothetical protein GCM10010297_16440 [Streptomyces malachitofuscus]|nr:hypothetical protein GCM10010297_16440 [Streptomyces malachitofuscus]
MVRRLRGARHLSVLNAWSTSVEPPTHLPETLRRLDALSAERGSSRRELLDVPGLARRTLLSEQAVRTLLNGGTLPADSVNERVRARIRALTDARLAQTGERMSDLAGTISRRLGVSAYWARQVCAGDKMPSVELLHGLVGFFQVEGGEAAFTAEASEALNRALLPLLAELEPPPESTTGAVPTAVGAPGHDDVRGIALRQARDLPPERWAVLNATLNALLELDNQEEDR